MVLQNSITIGISMALGSKVIEITSLKSLSTSHAGIRGSTPRATTKAVGIPMVIEIETWYLPSLFCYFSHFLATVI